MKVRESRKAEILIILGIVLVMVAPYLPNFFFECFITGTSNHGEIGFKEVIPSVRLGGMLFFAWGITILLKRHV